MKILSLILAACILVSASSCVYSDKDGQMWVTGRQGKIRIPLPNDPLRKILIDDPARERYEKRQAAMLASARSGQAAPQRVVSRNELLPPPAGYMFSSRRVAGGGYEIRGVTGKVERLSARDYTEFTTQCRTSGWLIYVY